MKSIFRLPHIPIFLLLFTALCFGYFTAPDYGLSWDEPGIYHFSKHTLKAYSFIFHPQDFQPDNSIPVLNLYGPAHFMYASFMSRLILIIHPAWSANTATHFMYFTTFLIGVLFLYFLAARWMSAWAALGTAALFISQPLFWGHAFINPKDTPFMSLFIVSVYLGFRMMDDPTWKKILAAGIALGLATSIRSLGPMAGALTILYGLMKYPRKMIPVLFWYSIAAIIVAYLTWPFLWKAPIAHFVDSLRIMSSFPDTGETLFMRNMYPADQLPARYIPTFIIFQLTEPALVLSALGGVLSLIMFIKEKKREPLLFFAAWFLMPISVIILSGSTLYDNARQILFLLPPLFVFAGIAIDSLLMRTKTLAWKMVLLFVITLPGIYACIQFHPYQYVYFNRLTGGTAGAFRNFDLDYWGTAFKESFEYINANAAPNSQVVVIGPRQIAKAYARPDLKIVGPANLDVRGMDYYYVLYSTRSNADEGRCKKAETVHTVERNGGILSVIKKATSEEGCW